MMEILRCKEPFAADIDGVPRVITAGQLLDSSDPVIKGRERFFEAVDAHMARRSREVEQATAAPGEKRSVTPADKPPRGAKSSKAKGAAGKGDSS